MEVTLSTSIRDVTPEEWEALSGADYVERLHGWLRTSEDSEMRMMHYVFVREHGKLVAAAHCYVYFEALYFVKIKFVDVKSFYSHTPEQAALLIKGLEEIRKREKARGIFFLFLKEDEFESVRKHVKGFTEVPLKEDTYIDLNFKDFDDYLKSLDEDAWRSARMTLKRASKEWKIRIVYTRKVSQWKDTVYRLQGYLCEKYDIVRTHFSPQFYEALEKNLGDNAELMIFFKDDVPIAVGLPFFSSTIAEYKLLGVDPEYRKYQAYFLLYYEGIRRAIERGQKRIYLGPMSYEFKERIGCKTERLYGLIRVENFVLNLILKTYITIYKICGKKF